MSANTDAEQDQPLTHEARWGHELHLGPLEECHLCNPAETGDHQHQEQEQTACA